RVDFVLLLWEGDRPRLRLVECKASRKDRSYQRVQACLYKIIVESLLQGPTPLVVGGRRVRADDVDCVVARIDEETNESQRILELPPLDLWMETADVIRLLSDEGTLVR